MAEAIKELKWVLTEHGKKRITEVLSNPADRIRINCIHIGRSNEGDFRARETINELLEPISYEEETGVYTKDISIYEKGISDELENTVYFKALIDENISGFEIKELALFEEIGNQLHMFAVGIGEPINKPALDKGYVISIDYTLLIESANLYDIYDRIELDPDNEFIKEVDAAITKVSASRTDIGSIQNRLKTTLTSLDVRYQNMASTLSTIQDTDVASEAANMTKSQILQSVSVSLLAQANSNPSVALNLI